MTTLRLTNTLTIQGKENQDTSITPGQSNPLSFVFDALNVAAEGVDLDIACVDLGHTLSGTSGTVDLTAAPLARDTTQSLDLSTETGKLHTLILEAPSTNTGNITFETGATNGYPILGAASSITLKPGERAALIGPSSGVAAGQQVVDATHKILDISGTDGDEIKCLAYFGTGT